MAAPPRADCDNCDAGNIGDDGGDVTAGEARLALHCRSLHGVIVAGEQ